VRHRFAVYFMALFLIGLVNNNGYVMVGATSHSMANAFNMQNLMPLYQLFLISASGCVRFLNAKFLIKIEHKKRLIFNTFYLTVGYIIIGSVAIHYTEVGFAFSLLASLILGSGSTFGESTVLGFLKGYPSELVVGWASGTGFAGISGTGFPLIFAAIGLQLGYMFFLTLPLIAVYITCFLWIRRQKLLRTSDEALPIVDVVDEKTIDGDNDIEDMQISQTQEVQIDEAKDNQNFTLSKFAFLLRTQIGYLCFCLSSVYFLEYSILTGFTDRVVNRITKENPTNQTFLYLQAYTILSFCYQIGVWLSRSSLKFFKIKHVWLLSAFQLVNFLLWLFQALYLFEPVYWVMFIHMVFVGLMGGGAYVNVMYQILHKEDLNIHEKELAVNICGFFNDMGILAASIFALIADQTFLSQYR